VRRAALLVLAVCLATPMAAAQIDTLRIDQEPPVLRDTVEVAPDTVGVVPERPVDRRPVLAPQGPPPGAGLTGVPVRQPVFDIAALLDPVPGIWRYNLGAFGGPDGVALGLTPPNRVTLSLDGRPAEDLFTGRAALERLPGDLLAPLSEAPILYGSPGGLRGHLRAYAAAVPVTEMRYRAGPGGQQFIGVTHAQTRRPEIVRRLGGDLARASALVHVSGERAAGEYMNAGLSGLHVVVRLGLALPGLALEITERHVRRAEGAWGGVHPSVPAIFDRAAPVRDPQGEREFIHNDLAVRALAHLLPQAPPLSLQAYWQAATHRYTGGDHPAARGHRYGFVVEQRVAAGEHRLSATGDLRMGRHVEGTAFPAGADPFPPEVHLSIRDSVSLEPFDIVLMAGAHASRDFAFPSGRVEVGMAEGAFSTSAAVFAGGADLSPVERLGFGAELQAGPVATERSAGGDFRAAITIGPATLDVSAEVQRRIRPRLLVIESDTVATMLSLDGSLTGVLGTAGLSFRAHAERGLYGRGWVAAHRILDAGESELHAREAAAMPELFGFGRVGYRARALFGGSLDLDLFVRTRVWSTFQSRTPHPATALLALPVQDDRAVPGRGVVDLVLDAGLGQGRARVFVAYQNALAGVAYPGVFLVPTYPLPEPALRVGVFWLLAN
jgi:hypothetical protein